MAKKIAAAEAATNSMTKIHIFCDLGKSLEYFRYHVGTSLDCALAMNILRNCVTWYIRVLERMDLLQAVYIGRDKRTGYKAKHYSTDPAKWVKSRRRQLPLLGKEVSYE